MKFSELFRFCPVCGSAHFVSHNLKSKRCGSCGFVMYVNPAAAVAVFVENESGELLVCTRAKEPASGTWDLPGGFVDENETVSDAVARELYEELGLTIKDPEFMFSLPNEYLYSGWTIPTLDFFFSVRVADNVSLIASDDVSDCFFMAKEAVESTRFGLKSIQQAVKIFLKPI